MKDCLAQWSPVACFCEQEFDYFVHYREGIVSNNIISFPSDNTNEDADPEVKKKNPEVKNKWSLNELMFIW